MTGLDSLLASVSTACDAGLLSRHDVERVRKIIKSIEFSGSDELIRVSNALICYYNDVVAGLNTKQFVPSDALTEVVSLYHNTVLPKFLYGQLSNVFDSNGKLLENFSKPSVELVLGILALVERIEDPRSLSQEEIRLLFSEGLRTDRDRALFGICLFTAARINEACILQVRDCYAPNGSVLPEVVIRKANTKNRLATRTIPVIEELRLILAAYRPPTDNIYLFPARRGSGHIERKSASAIFLEALQQANIIGVSIHNMRRTSLTLMSNAGIPLQVIQEISGHRDLGELQKYLEVSDS
jgi:integrase/recombinase XerD